MIKEYDIEDEHTNRDVEVLTSTIDELAKVKKQLKIAVNALKEYANCENWSNEYDLESASFEPLYWANKWKNEFGYKLAFEVLKQIEELDK